MGNTQSPVLGGCTPHRTAAGCSWPCRSEEDKADVINVFLAMIVICFFLFFLGPRVMLNYHLFNLNF